MKMSVQQVALVLPPEIEAGILAGEFIRKGSVVRNLAGEIVKHLDEVPVPKDEAGQIALRIPKALKNPKAVGIGLGFAAVVGVGAYLFHRTRRAKAESDEAANNAESVAFEVFSSALNDYLINAQESNLSLESIEWLMAAVSTLRKMKSDAEAVVEISAEKLAALVSVIYDYTVKLASANASHYDPPTSGGNKGLDAIADMLMFQKDLFEQAA